MPGRPDPPPVGDRPGAHATWIGPTSRRVPDLPAKRSAGIPMGRTGTPAEVAEAVTNLAAASAGPTTAQVRDVNGSAIISR